MKILVVDDLSAMRGIIRNLLRDIGYTDVYEAKDGHEAIKQLKINAIDFVITDWNMPNVSGLELLEHIRSEANLANLPVLMVTAEAKRDQIIAAAQAGINGYIVKPFTAASLKGNVDKILSKQADAG